MTRGTALALALAAVLLLACEAGPTGSISLFPDEEGGSTSSTKGGASNGSGGAKGGASNGGAQNQGGRAGSGGTVSRGGTAGTSARGGGEGRCSTTSCTTDTVCKAEGLFCNTLLRLCCLCNDDTQCTSPQHCERTEGHCE